MSLVSVIMPMRNARPWVRTSLESVLSQSGVELEVIVVDDGSTDGSTREVNELADPRVRLIAGPQRGISAAFNSGLAEARGQFVARCDSDDLYPPGRLEQQLQWLEHRPDFGAVCGGFSTIDQHGQVIGHTSVDLDEAEVTQELRDGVGRSHMCAYLFRADVLRKLGGCREWFETSEDADLQFRLSMVARVGFLPAPAYLYRLHDASITHTQKSVRRRFFERCAREFLEQRKTTGTDDLDRGTPPAPPVADDTAGAQSTAAQVQAILLGQAWQQHRSGSKSQAIRTGWKACLKRPLAINAWKSLAALVLK